MFDDDGKLDWTYYYAELAKAKAQRLMFFGIGLAVGFAITFTGLYVFLQYIDALP